MNIIDYLFMGLLIELGLVLHGSDSGCPNQLITSYPTNCVNIPNASNVPTGIQVRDSQCSSITTKCVSTSECCTSTPTCCSSTPTCCTSTTTCTCQTTNCCSQLCCQKPSNPIVCPPGTVLIVNSCHLLYCPSGSQMINGRCIVTECPPGSIWTGHSCSVTQPTVTNVTFHNTIITQFNQTKPQIILNNTNNIYVNASLSLNNSITYNNECHSENDDCDEKILVPSKTILKCCVVMTPRICEHHTGRWRCFSRRSRRCGEFCIAPIIYLRTSRALIKNQYLVMPPIYNDCQINGDCDSLIDGEHDCSGCTLNIMERCSYYCYRYTCPSRRCRFYDQETFCGYRIGLYGCQEEDGCFDSWCL